MTHDWNFGDGSPIFLGGASDYTVDHTYYDVNPYVTPIQPEHSGNGSVWCPTTIASQFPGIFVGTGCGSVRTISGLLSAGILPATTLVGKNFYVFGDLEVNASYIFDNCNIFVIAGGKITVKSGAQLTLRNNTVVDVNTGTGGQCPVLWKGIEVLSGGTLFTRNDVTIQDAYFAIRPIKDNTTTIPILSLQGITFKRNFIGIYAVDGNFALSAFRNNTFEGSGDTPIYTLGSCNPPDVVPGVPYSRRTYCGIYFHAIGGAQLLMPTLSLDNTFRDLQAGIVAIDGTTSIKGCRFENISYLATISALYQGTAVTFQDFSGGKYFIMYGLGKNGTPTIDNCERGIYAYTNQLLTSVSVLNCRMTEVSNGIELEEQGNGNFSKATIKDNYIGCTNYLANIKSLSTGIEIKDPNLAVSEFNIDGNDIDLDQPEAYSPGVDPLILPTGIRVVTVNNSTMTTVMSLAISLNNIHMINGHQGIVGENVENADISGNKVLNDVVINDFLALFGIYIKGGSYNAITCNNITQTTGVASIIGIAVEGSPRATVSENSILDLFSCISMLDNSGTRCDISYNDIAHTPLNPAGSVGIFYFQALTGPQYLQGNDWSGDFTNGAQYNQAIPTSYSYCDSRYHISPAANVDNATNPVITNTTEACGNWFTVLDETEPDYECGDIKEEKKLGKNEADLHLAGGGTSELSQGYQWTTEMGLYEDFTEHPEWIEGDEIIMAFLEAKANEPVAQMYNARKEIDAISVVALALSADIENTVAQLNENVETSIALLDLMDTDPDVSAEFAALGAQAEEWKQQLHDYLGLALSDAVVNASIASENNNAIACATLPCTLERYINGLYLETQVLSPRALTDAELEEVREIGLSCPAEAGAAPYLAQSWYYLQTGARLQNNCSSYLPEMEERQNQPKRSDLAQDLSLFPNPACSSASLRMPVSLNGGVVSIKDMWGKLLLKQKISEEIMFIPLTDFANGTYFVSAKDKNGTLTATQKMVIIH